jgi:cytochrome c556
MKTFAKAIVTIGSAIALTAGTVHSVSADDRDSIKYRQSVMKAISGHMGGAAAIIKGKVPYKDDLVAHVTALNETTKVLPNAFKQKTSGGKTRAKPEIWENSADFQQKIKNLQMAAADFLAAAKSGGAEAAGAKMRAVGDACGACHKKYRAKKS